jgi:hypothetical protein
MCQIVLYGPNVNVYTNEHYKVSSYCNIFRQTSSVLKYFICSSFKVEGIEGVSMSHSVPCQGWQINSEGMTLITCETGS